MTDCYGCSAQKNIGVIAIFIVVAVLAVLAFFAVKYLLPCKDKYGNTIECYGSTCEFGTCQSTGCTPLCPSYQYCDDGVCKCVEPGCSECGTAGCCDYCEDGCNSSGCCNENGCEGACDNDGVCQ